MTKLRTVAHHPRAISPIVLGGNVFGWSLDEKGSFAVLDAFLEAGGSAIDTANTYVAWAPGCKGGESEEIIGRWIKDRDVRKRVFLATKVGMEGGQFSAGLSREQVRRGVAGSLQRLGVDKIDLYYAHRDDPHTPLSETVAAFAELVDEGVATLIGASNYTPERFADTLAEARSQGVTPFSVLQPEFNILDRSDYPPTMMELCQRKGIAVMPYYSLARGFLTGKYRPGQEVPTSVRAGGVMQRYCGEGPQNVLRVLDDIAAAHNATPAQVALAWLIAHPAITAPIASATTPQQVNELMQATHLELTAEEWEQLDRVGS